MNIVCLSVVRAGGSVDVQKCVSVYLLEQLPPLGLKPPLCSVL